MSAIEVVTLLMIHKLRFVFQIKKKNVNAKIFNLISGVNEIRFFVQKESWEYKCGVNKFGCNS